jgi:hypothetical protein
MDRKRIGGRVLAAGLLAAGVLGGSVASANASTRIAGSDDVTIAAPQWDFGGKTFDDTLPGGGQPTNAGSVKWLLDDGIPAPHLVGTLHATNAKNTCAHMQILYLNSSNTVIHTTDGGEVCVTKDKHKQFKVDFGTYANIFTAKVTINLISTTGLGSSILGAHTVNFGPYTDDVLIKQQGWDFGGLDFANNKPTGPGTGTWTYNLGPRFHLNGYLHANKVGSDCARMQLEYLDVLGNVVNEEHGGTVCAPDNGHKPWSVDFGGSVTSTSIVAVNVNIQTLNSLGNYQTAGTQKVSFSDLYLIAVPV